MKVVVLAASNVVHTEKWVNGLARNGLNVTLISIHELSIKLDHDVAYYQLNTKAPLGYFFASKELKNILRNIAPDILNVHYATGYGYLARKVGFAPTVLSVWGSDIYEFPKRSFLHKWLLKKNLAYCTRIVSSSACMREEIFKLYGAIFQIDVIPYGVDLTTFNQFSKDRNSSKKIVLGTVKTLEVIYGVDRLIKCFSIVNALYGEQFELQLRITGKGSQLNKLKALAQELGVNDKVHFLGSVPHAEVPMRLKELDIYIALSRRESFGVAIVEAMAMGLPVVVSNAEGPSEVVIDQQTGFVCSNQSAAVSAIGELIASPAKRYGIGVAARSHVEQVYDWDECVIAMVRLLMNSIDLENRTEL